MHYPVLAGKYFFGIGVFWWHFAGVVSHHCHPSAYDTLPILNSPTWVSKNYAVGLEMLCPGGACYWAPEIPSDGRLAGTMSNRCELVHYRTHSAQPGEASVPRFADL